MKRVRQYLGVQGMVLALMGGAQALAETAPLFPEHQNCVAWKAKKTFFFVKKEEPVGVNCGIRIQRLSASPSHYQIQVEVPIDQFNSTEPKRDEEVRALLKEKDQAAIVFLSDAITAVDWPRYLQGQEKQLQGVLRLGGQAYPVTLQFGKDPQQEVLRGNLLLNLSSLGIEAPRMLAGVMVKVDDAVELLFQAQITSLEGKP